MLLTVHPWLTNVYWGEICSILNLISIKSKYHARNFVFIFASSHNFQGGIYILNMLDVQSGGVSLIFLAFVEIIVISWGYGKPNL